MTPSRKLIFNDEARFKLLTGVAKVADVVSAALGPQKWHVGFEENGDVPPMVNDGYSLIKDLEFKDQFVNMGAAIAKKAAITINKLCGDGIATTIVLLKALVEEGIKSITAGINPIALKRELEKGVKLVLEELDKLSMPIADILPVAIASARGDETVGRLIAEAVQQTGRKGVIVIEEGKNVSTTLEKKEGFQIAQGYLSPYFCTNREKLSVEMHQPAILLTDQKISSIQEIIPLLQTVATTGQELLIVADDFEGNLLSTLIMNKLQGTLQVCAIKVQKTSVLEDLAAFTGATVVSKESGLCLKEAAAYVLGFIEKVVVLKDKTIFVGKNTPRMQKQIQQIEVELSKTKGRKEKKGLQNRKAQLLGKIAILRVGGTADSEIRQKKQLFENSLNATWAAIEEGIVSGGGTALLRASRNLQENDAIGLQIILKACEAPFRQIVQNTRCDSSLYLKQVLSKPHGWGFNALTEEVEDLMKSGIVDSSKVVKNCLKTALSAAETIFLSSVLIGHGSV